MSDATKSYLFHGAPDIVTRKESSFSMITTEGSGDLEFTVPRVIENSRQVMKPISISHICLPQKLGEVIAQTHFLASACLLRYCIKGNVPDEIVTKGLLFDKNTGGYHVQLSASVSSADEEIPVYVTINRQIKLCGLHEEMLCKHLKKLFT